MMSVCSIVLGGRTLLLLLLIIHTHKDKLMLQRNTFDVALMSWMAPLQAHSCFGSTQVKRKEAVKVKQLINLDCGLI